MMKIVLALGDGAAIILFAGLGREAHHETGSPILSTLGVALPFLIGWYTAAVPLGAYDGIVLVRLRELLTRTARAWIVGAAVGLVLRSLIERHIVPLPFVIVTLVVMLAFLLIWRGALYTMRKAIT